MTVPVSPPLPESSASDPESSDVLAARRVALALLGLVVDRRQALDLVLDTDRDFLALPVRDRAFVRMLVATSLRRCGQIDDFIARAMDRAEPPRPPLLHNLLRLGMTQLAFMAAPDYAVVDTSVRLAASVGLERQKGLVNAVLRRAATEHQAWLAAQDEARLNVPDWLLKSWIADYGLRTAAEIAQASLAEAPLDITPKDSGTQDQWAAALSAVALPTGGVRRLNAGPIQDLPGFAEGAWWVQDAAASIPAQLLGPVAGQTVVDMCAAPGGKTAQLAARGANVIALDRSGERLKRLQDNMRRLALTDRVRVEVADAAAWRAREPVKFILLDAPCSATGTIRRHPDVLHLKSAPDVERLAVAQARLLAHAAAQLESGGVLVYCTCSLQKAEGEAQIDALLARDSSLTRLPVTPDDVGGMADIITPEGDVRILPFHLAAQGGMDGFYAARLKKL